MLRDGTDGDEAKAQYKPLGPRLVAAMAAKTWWFSGREDWDIAFLCWLVVWGYPQMDGL